MRQVLMFAFAFVMWCGTPASAQVAAAAAPDRGQTLQGNADRVAEVLKAGQTVVVLDDTGRKVEGRIVESPPDTIRLETARRFEDFHPDRIVRIEHPDGLGNGARIGMGVGLVTSLLGVLGSSGGHLGVRLAFSASTTLVYTAIGVGIDALVDNRRTIYERGSQTRLRLSPVINRHEKGIALAVSW